MLAEADAMHTLVLAAVLALAIPAAAHAEPQLEARSAMGACLAAIIDGAPVAGMKGRDVEVRRELDPDSCTVQVTAGDPAAVRAAVIEAVGKRPEAFAPARTAWDPNGFASRETFCSRPGRRALNVVVSTAKPGEPLALIATVFEAKARDTRCDRDEGLQKPVLGG